VNNVKSIDGKGIAAQLLKHFVEQVQLLVAQGCQPALAEVLVGEGPSSQVYVRRKVLRAACCVLRAAEVGIRSLEFRLPADAKAESLLASDRAAQSGCTSTGHSGAVARAYRRTLGSSGHQPG
jgi:methylenetetrahydrofolate dehydrogenase (NADP+)/methenyltetrahydrofolate cyclohydrolase